MSRAGCPSSQHAALLACSMPVLCREIGAKEAIVVRETESLAVLHARKEQAKRKV